MSLATTRLSIQLVVVFVVVVVSKRSPLLLLLLLLLLLPVSVVAEVVEAVVVGWQLEFASQEQPSGQIYGPQRNSRLLQFSGEVLFVCVGQASFPLKFLSPQLFLAALLSTVDIILS